MLNERGNRSKELLDKAHAALAAGNHETAVDLLHKSAEGYLIRREFGKAREIFALLFSHLATQGLLEKVFFIVRRVIGDFERSEAFEEGGDLLRRVADLAQKNQEFRVAAEFYRIAGDFLQRSGGEETFQLAAVCFARAAEAYELEKKPNKAERLYVRAVMSALKIDQELLEVAEKGWRSLAKNRYNSASEHFRSVSNAFRRGVPELQKMSAQMEHEALSANTTARLYHLSATFAFLTALCFFKIERMDLSEEEFAIVRDAALNAIETTMPILENELADREDKWRTSVDLLLLVISDYFAGVPWEHESLLAELKPHDDENEAILLAAELISHGRINRSLDYLDSAELGMLDAAKNLIMEALRSKKEIS